MKKLLEENESLTQFGNDAGRPTGFTNLSAEIVFENPAKKGNTGKKFRYLKDTRSLNTTFCDLLTINIDCLPVHTLR